MATLQKIRNRGTLLVAFIGIALLAFILGDLLTSGTTLFNKARDKAFVVNGQVISTKEYFDRVEEWSEFQKTVNNQSTLDESATAQIREIVYDQMVREIILDNQATKLGIVVSKEELNDLVHGENISPLLQQLPFFLDPQTGIFSREALIEFLNEVNATSSNNPEEQAIRNQYKSMWLFIENMIKYQRLQEKYNTLLSSAIMTNDVEAKTNFELSQQNADIVYAMQNYYTVPDSTVTVSNKEIKDYYNKNKSNYKLNVPGAKISYFIKEIIPSDEDFAEVETAAHEAYAKLKTTANPAAIVADYSETPYRDIFVAPNLLSVNQRDFVNSAAINDTYGPVREGDAFNVYKLIDKISAPDSVRLRVMAVPEMIGQDSIITHFMDSIYTEIRSGNKTFADVANSLNPQSNGGDIGWVREVDLASAGADLVKAAFNAPIGELTKMHIPGQQIIFQVEEKTKPVQKYKIAAINMPVLVSDKTSNNVDNELNQFMSDPEVKNDFVGVASSKGYAVVPDFRVSATDFGIAQVNNSRQIINWAFNDKVKSVRKFDLTNLRVIAIIDEVIPAGYAPLSEVSASIRSQLVKDKKAEKMIADLKAANITNINDYAAAMKTTADTVKFVNFNTQTITGLGFEPVINAYSAHAPLHTLMGPEKGNMGVLVANVIARTQGTEQYNATEQKEILNGSKAYRLQMQSMETLKDKLKVIDNRFRFF